MDTISIRKAVREDCPRLLELVRGLAEYEKSPDEVTITPGQFEQSGFGVRNLWEAFVAETGGSIIGFALWYTRFSTWKGPRLYLENIYVEPEFRGMGAGAKLFDALIWQARNEGYGGMVWQVLDWNEPAIRFYKKYGAKLDNGWTNCSLEF